MARKGQLSKAAEIAAMVNSVHGRPVVKMASDQDFIPVKIPTGSFVIDRITGGGFTLGRHVELFGDENACKSYVAYRTMALSQRRGNVCALVDPEGTFDADWFSHLGGLPDELLYERPDDAEEAVATLRTFGILARQGEPIEVVTVDSIAALVTKEQVEKDPRDEERVASQARMMSRALRVVTSQNRRILFIWTNQDRMNIGFGAQFQPRTQPGGRAMKYYATSRIEFKKSGRVTRDGLVADKHKLAKKAIPVGNWIQVRAEKEKSTVPYRQGMFVFNSRHGEIDRISEIIQLGLEDDVIQRSGNTFSYEDLEGRMWSGAEKNFKKMIEDNDDLWDEIAGAVADMTVALGKVE